MKLPGKNLITLNADAVKMMIESELNNGTRDKRHRVRITELSASGYSAAFELKLEITTDLDPNYVEPEKTTPELTVGEVIDDRPLTSNDVKTQRNDYRFPL